MAALYFADASFEALAHLSTRSQRAHDEKSALQGLNDRWTM
jgi:hypothetical protein